MKKYNVVVYYDGKINYQIEANNKKEAIAKAKKLFGDESPAIIEMEIANSCIGKCSEIEEC